MWRYTLIIKGKFDRPDDLPEEIHKVLVRGPKQDEVVCPNLRHHQKFDETFVTFVTDWDYINELNNYFCDFEKYGETPMMKEGGLLFYSISRVEDDISRSTLK